jgi:hypothetical protein
LEGYWDITHFNYLSTMSSVAKRNKCYMRSNSPFQAVLVRKCISSISLHVCIYSVGSSSKFEFPIFFCCAGIDFLVNFFFCYALIFSFSICSSSFFSFFFVYFCSLYLSCSYTCCKVGPTTSHSNKKFVETWCFFCQYFCPWENVPMNQKIITKHDASN